MFAEFLDAALNPVDVRADSGEDWRPGRGAAKADAEGGEADDGGLAVSGVVNDQRAAGVTLEVKYCGSENNGNNATAPSVVEPSTSFFFSLFLLN